MTSVYFQDKPFNITVIQVCTPTTDVKETEVDWFYEDLQHQESPFHHRELECQSRKSRDSCNNKFGLGVQNEAG